MGAFNPGDWVPMCDRFGSRNLYTGELKSAAEMRELTAATPDMRTDEQKARDAVVHDLAQQAEKWAAWEPLFLALARRMDSSVGAWTATDAIAVIDRIDQTKGNNQ